MTIYYKGGPYLFFHHVNGMFFTYIFKVNIFLDDVKVDSSPDLAYGFKVSQPKTSKLLLEIPTMHFEVEVNIASADISIKAPSSMYKNKLEGLCGMRL